MKNVVRTHFCVLGPGKAGTTWLYHLFRENDQVCVPLIKETEFFKSNYSKGVEWYLSLFDFTTQHLAFGDISNQNYKSPDVIEKCLKLFPSTLFIYVLRDPRDRFLSAYRFELKQGRSLTIEAYASEWDLSLFDDQAIVRRLQECVPMGQLLLVRFEDISSRPHFVAQLIGRSLGVQFLSFPTQDARNTSVYPRSRVLAKSGRFVASQLRRLGFLRLLPRLKNSFFISRMFYTKIPVAHSHYDVLFVNKVIPEEFSAQHQTGIY